MLLAEYKCILPYETLPDLQLYLATAKNFYLRAGEQIKKGRISYPTIWQKKVHHSHPTELSSALVQWLARSRFGWHNITRAVPTGPLSWSQAKTSYIVQSLDRTFIELLPNFNAPFRQTTTLDAPCRRLNHLLQRSAASDPMRSSGSITPRTSLVAAVTIAARCHPYLRPIIDVCGRRCTTSMRCPNF